MKQYCSLLSENSCKLITRSHYDQLLERYKAFLTMMPDEMPDDEPDDVMPVVNGVGVIPIHGPMDNNVPQILKDFLGIVDYQDIQAQLKQFASDVAVQVVILDIDSGGGSILGLEETLNTLNQTKAQKPVVVWSNGYLCSAAYAIASQASVIAVSPSCQLPFIGVTRPTILDFTKNLEDQGIKQIEIYSGKFKHTDNGELHKYSQEDIDYLQGRSDKMMADFKQWVSSARPNVTAEQMEAVILSGKEAVGTLVDVTFNDTEEFINALLFGQNLGKNS